ncbi:hypothetical protein BDZ94DRAFT_1330631 [Collybia nuda]|uniref:Uncharacterized protein n=1 Tax=Collybia nuda TaxID=64659 RepID=A0A9P5XWG0_9AGAR|nr:hypothetical protein BDZ94DRAFT_1330631 [Collybia nuda]
MQNMPQTLQEIPINIVFISVSPLCAFISFFYNFTTTYTFPAVTNLNDIFLQEFPSMKATPLLINHITKIATTKKNPREPSSEVTMFISRIEGANPNSPELIEDDTNAGWGHHQFTAGSLTISTVLVSWDAISSVSTACKLISATIKTCQVARYMCNKQGINLELYMSNAYLDRIVDKLTDLTAKHSSETRVTAHPEVCLNICSKPPAQHNNPG